MSQSIWRELLYKKIENYSLDGVVLDLGGSRKSRYHSLLPGTHTFEVVNLETGEGTDHVFDIEKPFPLGENTYDHVVCFNVLDHVFNYQNVLNESHRVLKKGGTALFAVPFVMQVHLSPNDYWRYTGATLERIFKEAGFKEIEVEAVGTGVFGAANLLKHHLYRPNIVRTIFKRAARLMDHLIPIIKRDNLFTKEYFPLGYIIRAKK